MRHPKRFCVRCSKSQSLTIRRHRRYSMYHCRNCGDEICRMGDGTSDHALQAIPNLDVANMGEQPGNLLLAVCGNPDFLSDEHRLWITEEEAGDKESWGRTAIVSLALLTPRQREIANAIQQHNSQEKAAKALGITQQAISRIMHQIRKKLQADGCILDRSGHD